MIIWIAVKDLQIRCFSTSSYKVARSLHIQIQHLRGVDAKWAGHRELQTDKLSAMICKDDIKHICMYIIIYNSYIYIYFNYRFSHNTSSFSYIMRTIVISNSLDIKVWTSFPAASPTTLLYPFLLPSTGVLTGHSQCCRFHQHMFAQLDIDLTLQVSTRSHPTNMWW